MAISRYVLDQNVMRDAGRLAQFQSNYQTRLVIPDTAFIEMLKSEPWDYTLRRSFKLLSPMLVRVFLSGAISEMMKREIQSSFCVTRTQILPNKRKKLIQRIVTAVNEKGGLNRSEGIGKKIDNIRDGLIAENANASIERHHLLNVIRSLEARIPPEIIKKLRANKLSRAEKLELIQSEARKTIDEDVQFSSLSTEKFWRRNPLTLRFIYMLIWSAVRWLEKQGFEQTKHDKILNDVLDQEYIILGTYFDGLITKDSRSTEAFKDLKDMILRGV